MIILAKILGGDLYPDLVNQGFVPGHSVRCSQCDTDYRVFYSPQQQPSSVLEQANAAPSVEDAVERSHPEHPDRIRL
jgi:hypothetical protein